MCIRDWSRIMEKILVLTHADETGTALSRASLEAVTAGLELAARLGAPLGIGVVGSGAAIENSLAAPLPTTPMPSGAPRRAASSRPAVTASNEARESAVPVSSA